MSKASKSCICFVFHRGRIKNGNKNCEETDMAFYERVMDVVGLSESSEDSVTVVSGLPRSGTSMMMQLLSLGGYESLTDNIRKDDSRNPRGYFEYEPVKDRLSYDRWLPEAKGKAIKVVSRFLPFLPSTYRYNIVFMHRSLDAVIHSQRDMAEHYSGTDWDDSTADRLRGIYGKHLDSVLAWIKCRPNIRLWEVRYEALLSSPEENLRNLTDFLLPCTLHLERMVGGIEARLDHSCMTGRQ